ncbi:MAG: sugar transferase [Cyanobacteria bacterium P01_A01_bin.84]
MIANQKQVVKSATQDKLVKKLLDRLIAAIALFCLIPLLIIVAIAVHFRMGDPILFTQTRSGRRGRIFKVYKFRSMTNDCDRNGNLLSDEDRLTSFGKFIRRVKLDETLQLWNILKGDMSFVGPRPTLPEQVQDYQDWQKTRLYVTPGLTGWAQVNGNTELTWTERICLDIWYLHHWSLWMDMEILLKTLLVVIWGERRNEKALSKALKYAQYTLKVDFDQPVAESLR